MAKLIDPKKILEATNGGLDIILDYYPQAAEAASNRNKKFKIRPDEKTASATMKQADDGNWVVTDWGSDQVHRNAIAICQLEEPGMEEFGDALKFLAAKYRVDADLAEQHFQPKYQQKPAPQDMGEGYHYVYNDRISDAHRNVLGEFVDQDLCDRYNLKSVHQYIYCKKDSKGNLVQHIFTEQEHYPIFQFECGTWRKRMEPRAIKKDQRFRYDGDRPKDYIFGLEQCQEDLEALREQKEAEAEEKGEEFDPKAVKLPYIILCSGDRDALAVASIKFSHVIWMNSESADLSAAQYKSIMELTEQLYNIPDIDNTGKKQGHKLAMKYLDIKTIELPQRLLRKKDQRGNPCKDVRDYLQYESVEAFRKIFYSALPYRFWDEIPKSGYTDYRLNNVQLYNFLMKNGFYRIRLEKNKLGYIYIRIVGNVVEEVESTIIKSFVHDFLRDRHMPTRLRNMFFRSANGLNETSFSNLDIIDIEFKSYTRTSQFMFFKNVVWEITARGIQEHKPGTVSRYVWKDEIIDHDVKLHPEPWKISYKPEEDQYHIASENHCLFFKYLRNASRMFWQKQDEGKISLTEAEKAIQHRHLVNKLYAFGYLLHHYKDRSKAWAVYVSDNLDENNDISESWGGTGKSLGLGALDEFMRTDTIPARNSKIFDNQFLYGNINKYTGFVLFDDACHYFRFDNLFSEITGKWRVNSKFGSEVVIDFEDSPKIGITTNFGDSDQSPSASRRKLHMVYSDYYHDNENGQYKESRRVADDIGKNLFTDFTKDEWNLFFNTMAWACSVFLRYDKIDPPMANVRERTLRNQMTDSFKAWADVYFSKDSGNRDVEVPRPAAFIDYTNESNQKRLNSQSFYNRLKAWCKYYGFELDPEDRCNNGKRIVAKLDGKTVQMIHIRTMPPEAVTPDNSKDDDIPF